MNVSDSINSPSSVHSLLDFFNKIKSDPFIFIIPAITVLVRLIIFLNIPFTYEDAYITFRYAENLANGNGLVYNLGEYVYGTTTPLYAMILALFNYIGISCTVASLGINLISEAITSLIIYKILKEYSEGIIAVVVSLLYVFSPSNISWSIQGMETAFFTGLIATSLYLLYNKNYFYAVLFAFLSAMTRIDGLSVVAVVCFFTFYEKSLSSIRMFLFPLLLFVTWLLFLYIYFGSFLPNSMLAKLVLYSGHNPNYSYGLNLVLSKFFIVGYYSSTIITLLFFLGVFIVSKKNKRLLPMISWFFIYFVALILSKTSIHGWYLIPPLFVFTAVSGIGIIFIFQKVLKLLKLKEQILKLSLFILLMAFSSLMLFLKIKQIYNEYQYEKYVRIPIGLYLKNNSPENATVFLEPIGVIGYYSGRYIYDDAALVSPIFIELNRQRYDAQLQYKKIELVKPNYLVIRDRDLQEFYSTTKIVSEYKAVKNFVYPMNPNDASFLSMTIFERLK